jgi:hypothetical protein
MAVLMLLSTADSLSLHRQAGAEVSRPGDPELSRSGHADLGRQTVTPPAPGPAEEQRPLRPGAGRVRRQ